MRWQLEYNGEILPFKLFCIPSIQLPGNSTSIYLVESNLERLVYSVCVIRYFPSSIASHCCWMPTIRNLRLLYDRYDVARSPQFERVN